MESQHIGETFIKAVLDMSGIPAQILNDPAIRNLRPIPIGGTIDPSVKVAMREQLDSQRLMAGEARIQAQQQLAAQRLLASQEIAHQRLASAQLTARSKEQQLQASASRSYLQEQIQGQRLITAQAKLEQTQRNQSAKLDNKPHNRIITTSEVVIKVEKEKQNQKEVKTNNPGVLSGAMQEIGRNAVKNFAETVQRNFVGADGILGKLGDKLAAPVKIFITDNPELKSALGRTSSLIEDRLRKAGYSLGDAIIAGLDNQNTTIKDKLYRVGGTVVPFIKPAVNQVKADAKSIGRDVSGALSAGTVSGKYAQKADALIQDYRQGAINDRAIPQLLKRASEIAAETKPTLGLKPKELIIASSAASDKEKDALLERIKQDANKGAQIDYVQKRDTTAAANVRGYSRDSIEMAAKGLAALEKNPTIKIKFVGEGQSGEAAEGAAKMLKMLGVNNVSYLGVGTSDFIGTPKDAPGRKISSSDEAASARIARTYSKAGLTRKSENEILGVKGDYYQSYSDQNLAEIQNFYKGAPKELTAKEITKLQKTADNFAKIDTQNMDEGALERVSIQAQRNLQKVRRHIIDAVGEPNQQLVSIAKTFESVNVATTPESAKLAQARAAIKSSREILTELSKKPGIESARIAQTLNTQLKEVQASFSDQNRQQVGTAGRKYKSLDSQLNQLIDQSGNRNNYAIRQKAREPIAESQIAQSLRANIPVVQDRIKEISTKGLTVAATGTINVIGKAINAAYGAEKALLGEGGAKAVNALVAAVSVASLPGGHEAMGAIGHGVTQLAHMPLDAMAGHASASAGSLVDTALSGSVFKGMAPQITAAITQGLSGSAGAVANLAGSIATPFVVGAGAIKAAAMGADAAKKFDPKNSVVVNGARTFIGKQADNLQFGLLQNSFRNTTPKPAKEASQVSTFDGIKPEESDKIAAQILLVRKNVEANKKAILSNLSSNDPAKIDKGLEQAEALGHNIAGIKGSARVLGADSRSARERLMNDNLQVNKRSGAFAALNKSQKTTEELVNSDSLKTDDITAQIDKLQQNKGLVSKLKKGAVGAGAFASVMAALTTGAQAATVGGGAVASGGLMTGLLPALLPALGIGAAAFGVGALGVGAYQKYKRPKATPEIVPIARSIAPLMPQVADPWSNAGNFPTPIPPRQSGSSKFARVQDPWAQSPQPDGIIPLSRYTPPEPPDGKIAKLKALMASGIARVLRVPMELNQGVNNEIEKASQKTSNLGTFIGTSIAGLIAFKIASVALPMAMQTIGKSIELANRSINVKAMLDAASTSNTDAVSTVTSSKAVARKLGTSELDALENASRFKAAFVGTKLEGQGDNISSALAKLGKVRGANQDAIKLASTGATQMAQLETISTEEFKQISENLPGAGVEFAAANGMSQKQLKEMFKVGGAMASDMLPKFAARANAVGDLNLQKFEELPTTKVNAFLNEIEKLQVAVGGELLKPLGASAAAVSPLIQFLAENMAMFTKMGAVGLTLLAGTFLKTLPFVEQLGAALNSIKAQGFSAGLKGIGTAIAPMLQFGAIAAGITLAIDAFSSLKDAMTGDNAPSRVFYNDMAAAAKMMNESVAKMQGVKPTESALSGSQSTFNKYSKDRNLFDTVNDEIITGGIFKTIYYKVTGQDRESTRSTDTMKKTDLGEFDKAVLKVQETALTSEMLDPAKINTPELQKLRAELATVKRNVQLDKGEDPAKSKELAQKQVKLSAELVKKEESFTTGLVSTQAAIKLTEAAIQDSYYSTDKDFLARVDKLKIELPRLKEAETRLLTERARESMEVLRTATAIAGMTNNLTIAQAQISRFKAAAISDLNIKFAGSLNTGAKATEQYNIEKSSIEQSIAALTTALKTAFETAFKDPAVNNEITSLQKAGRLPQNLEDATDAQLAKIESDKVATPNTLNAIKAYNSTKTTLLTDQQKLTALTSERQSAIAQEIKASNEYYVNSIASIHQLELTSSEASRELLTKSYSSQFRTSMQGVNSAVGVYMSGLIDQFTALGELTKIETEKQKAEYDLNKQEYDAKINLENRQRANTVNGADASGVSPVASVSNGSAVVSPLKGASLAQMVAYQPLSEGINAQKFTDPRKRRAGAMQVDGFAQGAQIHGAIDYDSRVGGGTGGVVQAPIAGLVKEFDAGKNMGRIVQITGIDATGKTVTIGLTHIQTTLKTGDRVTAGQSVGSVVENNVGSKPHLDFTVIDGGVKKDPQKWLAAQEAAQSGTLTTASELPKMPKGSKLTPEVFARAQKLNKMDVGSVSTPEIQPSGSFSKAILRLIANKEVREPDKISGYFERQDKQFGNGHFSQSEASKGFPTSVGQGKYNPRTKQMESGENVGRYQVNLEDYNDYKKAYPKTKDFLPATQDAIAEWKMTQAGLKGRDKGAKSVAAFKANPSFENFQLMRRDLGAEWESLRDGITKYRGKDTGVDYLTKFNTPDRSLYKMTLANAGMTGESKLAKMPVASNTPTANFNPLPTPQSSPGQNDLGVYNAAIDGFKAQRERNEQGFALQKKTAEINIALNSINKSIATQTALRKEKEDFILKDQLAIQGTDQVGDMTPERQRKITVRDANFKRGDVKRKFAEDMAQIKDEEAKLTLTLGVFKEARTPELKAANPEQYKVLGEMIEYAKSARINIAGRVKQITLLGKKASDLASSVEDFNDVKNKRLIEKDLFAISISQRQRNEQKLGGELTAARTFTEANPFNYKKGDPLKIQSEIDLSGLKRKTMEDIQALKEKSLTASVPVKKDIEKAIEDATREYLVTYENIKSKLAIDIRRRDSDKAVYLMTSQSAVIESSLSVSSAQSQLYAAQGRTGTARQREYSDGFSKRQLENAQEITRLNKVLADDPSKKSDLEQMRKDLDAKYLLGQVSAATQFQRDRDLKLKGLGDSVEGSRIETVRGQAGLLSASGNTYDARNLEKQAAYRSEALSVTQKMREFDVQLLAEVPGSAEAKAIEQLRSEFEKLSQIKLDGLNQQFSQFKGVIDQTSGAFGSMFDKAITGQATQDDLFAFLRAPFKAVTDELSNFTKSAMSGVFKQALGGITGDLNRMMGGVTASNGTERALDPIGVLTRPGIGEGNPIPVQIVNSDFSIPPMPEMDFNSFDTSNILFPELDKSGDMVAARLQTGALAAAKTLVSGGDITKDLISTGIGALAQSLGGKSATGGSNWMSGLLSGLGGLFGMGASSPIMGPGFAEGGYTGAGGKYEPAGIVHKDEYVFDAVSTKRIGVRNLESMRAGIKGYSDGGLVTGASLQSLAPYNNILSSPRSIPVQQSTPKMEIEYKSMGGYDVVERGHLEERLAQMEYKTKQAFSENQKRNDDRAQHSLAYRGMM